MEILEKIDKLRIEYGWSINYLAMEAGLTQSTLNNLYVRKAEPKLSTLRAICNAFGITLSEFFADKKEEHESVQEIDEILRGRIALLTKAQKKTLLAFLNTVE